MKGAVPDYNLLSENSSLYLIDRGKMHYLPTYSGEKEWKPAKTKIVRSVASEQTFTKKSAPLKPSEHQVQGHVKFFPEQFTRKSEINDKLFETRRVVLQEDTGIPVKFRNSEEFKFEDYMNRKQRINSLSKARNGINVANPGDKAFKHPEHSANFYSIGGLIPGSSIKLKPKTSIVMKKSSDNQSRLIENKKLVTYAEKTLIMQKEEEENDVYILTVFLFYPYHLYC